MQVQISFRSVPRQKFLALSSRCQQKDPEPCLGVARVLLVEAYSCCQAELRPRSVCNFSQLRRLETAICQESEFSNFVSSWMTRIKIDKSNRIVAQS